MTAYLVRFELMAGPPSRLPSGPAFLGAAEENGLLWVVRIEGRIYALPAGMVWGTFASAAGALKAFDLSARSASMLLGFKLRPARALAIRLQDVWPGLATEDAFSACLFHQLYRPPGVPASVPMAAGTRFLFTDCASPPTPLPARAPDSGSGLER